MSSWLLKKCIFANWNKTLKKFDRVKNKNELVNKIIKLKYRALQDMIYVNPLPFIL